jgi:hypothetical protein
MSESGKNPPKSRFTLRVRRHHDLSCFASPDETSPNLNCVRLRVAEKMLEATDLRILVRAPVEILPIAGEPEDLTLPLSILKLAGQAPQTLQGHSLEVDTETNTASTRVTKGRFNASEKLAEAVFPKTERVFPFNKQDRGETVLTTRLNPQVLGPLVDYARRVGATSIRFYFKGSALGGVAFEVENGEVLAEGLLMPMTWGDMLGGASGDCIWPTAWEQGRGAMRDSVPAPVHVTGSIGRARLFRWRGLFYRAERVAPGLRTG